MIYSWAQTAMDRFVRSVKGLEFSWMYDLADDPKEAATYAWLESIQTPRALTPEYLAARNDQMLAQRREIAAQLEPALA